MNRNRRAIFSRHHEDVAPLLESARYLVLVSVNNLTGEYDQKRVTRRRLNRSSIMGPPLSKPFNGPLYVMLCDYKSNGFRTHSKPNPTDSHSHPRTI